MADSQQPSGAVGQIAHAPDYKSEKPSYGQHFAEVVADVREWGDAPKHVRERCIAAEAERDRYREALIECARHAGAYMSDGVPIWPPVDEWAVAEVEQMREDYDNG